MHALNWNHSIHQTKVDGLLGGDIILEVNNIKIESKTSYIKIRRSIEQLVEKKENFTVKVFRGGDIINLSTYVD